MEVAAAASTPVNTEPTPSVIAINLNELPSSTSLNQPLLADSLSVVLAFLNHLTLPTGLQPELPRDFNGSDCATCGLPEVTDQMVVCDGCERGFHLDCARIQGKRKQPVVVKFDEDWMCAECVSNAVPCDRWPLGFKAKAPGNKNGSLTLPFVNGEGEGTDDLPDSRKHSPGDNSFGGDRFGVPVTYLNLPHGENGSNIKEASHSLTPCFKLDSEDRRLHTQEASGIFGEVNLHSDSEVLRRGSQTGIRMQSQSPEEIHLEALREYILERHGSLTEAWSVKLKQSRNSDEPHAIYCSPDGKTFQSMSEVACYLGLMPKRGRKRSNEYASAETGAQLSRIRKSARLSAASSSYVAESKKAPLGSLPKEESTSQTSGFGGKSGGDESKNLNDRLPVQLEDFFILSFGKIDPRPAYHNADRIWPVGYKSCWHDKITGSVFVCEVSDGGDSGPIFIVRRFSCSTLAIPSSSTVLCRANLGKSDGKSEEKIVDHDEDYNVMRFLAEPSPPGEHDVFSCLGSSFNECPDLRTSNEVQLEALASHGRCENVPSDDVVLKDEIGGFSVEECSASSAWRRVSEKFNDICGATYKQNGNVRFICKHDSGGIFTSIWDKTHESCEDQFAPLAKFHGSMHHSNIPTIIQDDKEMKSGSEFLVKWLDQDRFGLDMEFVQEFVERLPGATACSRYVVCNDRSSPTSSLMLGNGILQIKTKDVGLTRYDEFFHKSEGHKSPKKQMEEDPVVNSHSFPPGKPISSRLPSQCVGNVLEAHELLCRFHEVLGLREPLSFEELEQELIHPWLGGLDLLEKTGREFKESQDRAMPSGSSCGHILSSSLDSGPVVSAESPHAFIPTETGAMGDAAEARMTSLTYMGYALTKAHKSLLSVLISELQLRVSAVIDPNVDGESKPKRGRKRDIDIWITGKRAKYKPLPLNELTWPEIARRYILAFLSMCFDWFDINTRESPKIFRCLQGDGGFLCGSKTGVVGKEEDAKLLAGAIKRIFGSSDRDGDILYMEDISDGTSSCKSVVASNNHVPEWVEVLEPVRKLPTNVGARIRNRVNDALKLGPPEWAKIVLEQSISKGVYKGNASGPTKKAVLKVLERVSTEIMLQKTDRQKPDMKSRKKLALISEIIMRKCRIVLRRAVAADAKDINRRKLINGTDNDDEGILESPTMVSRPLDFRIIDLRLAAGAYGGSHEAFLEDVRELWNNRRIIHADQPNLVELVGELSTNFESLYEQEVLTLFRRLVDYAKSESLSAESKTEIEGLLDSMCEVPKASWEEGVCKVCGIDKDDNTVLLCDQCDAEYHTYCLNPPLARIPDGNWYCPSCASGGFLVPDTPQCERGNMPGLKKFRGKAIHDFVEPLSHLVNSLEEREYWELSADERIFMIKFLCDELLNSSLIRHHLEQSLETSTDLMQKVRSLSVELKNLNAKEERLAARAAKVDRGSMDAVGDVRNEEGFGSAPETDDTFVRELRMRSDQCNCIGIFSDDISRPEVCQNDAGLTCGSQTVHSAGAEDQAKSVQTADCEVVAGDSAKIALSKNGCTCQKKLISLDYSDVLSDELDKPTESDNYMMFSSADMRGFSSPRDTGSTLVQEDVPLIDGNKSQPDNLELTSVRNEVELLQNTITSTERQLVRLSARREFLGNDSVGRFYWGFSESGTHRIVVNGNKELQFTERMTLPFDEGFTDDLPTNEGSRASCPYLRDLDGANHSFCTWVSYQSDLEIKELVEFLKVNDPNKIKLIDSILDWQERRFQGFRQNEIHMGKPRMACKRSEDCEKSVSSTIAATLLQRKYGPFSELEATEHLKNRRKAKATAEQKMFRCECLEPVWLSRHHCLFCHRTFSTVMEFDGHNGCNCNVFSSASVKSKKCADMIERKGEGTENAQERTGGVIKSQIDGLAYPFNFEDICSKFLIASSNKQLVSEIGLIGSNGIPSFVPSTSPYLNDPTLVLVSPKDLGLQSDKHAADHLVLSDVEKMTNDSLKCAMTEVTGPPEANEAYANLLDKNDQKSTLPNTAPLVEGSTCCVVPSFSSRPLVGRARHILRELKINLLDMEAALPEEGMRPYRASSEKRWAWRAFVKSVETIYEMVQATIVFEDMIKSEYLTKMWWYWSSLSAAAKISTLSHLALRIYSLDAAIDYEKISLSSSRMLDKNQQSHSQSTEKNKVGRKPNKKRREAEA